jgi:putative transposase
MKKTRFSEEQMVKILREADHTPVAEVAKRHGISDVTIYAWRKRFGKLESVDVKRLRQLEQENARLKKLVAERVVSDAGAGGAVSAVWVSAHPGVPRPARPRDECRSNASVMAPGSAASAEKTASPARRQPSPSAVTHKRGEPGLGL